jgi:acetyl esterase/lipase
VIVMVSGGWFSAHETVDSPFITPFRDVFLKRGYTVFALVHASTPKYSIPEILPMTSRAVRYIRHNAKEFGLDPERLGVTGGSAGGHLSLMQGCAPVAADPKAKDEVDRESAKVAAVGCFFPPTDFLNYGTPGHVALGEGELAWLKGPFQFSEVDAKTNSYVVITDAKKREEIGRAISPITHVSADDVPTLIIHGDADKLVPIQQSEIMVEALKKVGVPAKLVVKPGAGHGWGNVGGDLEMIAEWFDEYLVKKGGAATTPEMGAGRPRAGSGRRHGRASRPWHKRAALQRDEVSS